MSGRVHGIEVSTTMLSRAARHFRGEIADGRLTLHAASLTDLPLPNASLDGAITVARSTSSTIPCAPSRSSVWR
jgi:arsenite methyltransferase